MTQSVRSIKIVTDIPGPQSRRLMEEADRNVPVGVRRLTPVAIASSKGALVTDLDGNTYIDFAGGIGVLNFGHCPEEAVQAVKEQASSYLHACFHVTPYEPYVRLAALLNRVTPGAFAKKTMLVNSGAEAVENAVKIARHHTKRHSVIAFLGGFHGRTALTMSLTGQIHPYKYGFGPSVPNVYHLPYAYCYRCAFSQTFPSCDLACVHLAEKLFESVVPADQVAAMILEPVQGEGGFIVPPKEFLQEISRLCRKLGIIYIDDEVQAGIGRTGKLFGIEHYSIEPDLLLTGKSLGGGTVLGGVTGRGEIMDSPAAGGLGTTFGGNPLSCQAALAVLNAMDKNSILAKANRVGQKLRQSLEALQERYQIIGDVRGLGAMVAIELVKDRKTKEPATKETSAIRETCYKNGLITLGAGIHHNVIRVLAPLVIADTEIEEAISVLGDALGKAS